MSPIAGSPSMFPSVSLSELSRQINGLLAQRTSMAQWWVDLTDSLDVLGSRLLSRRAEASRSGWLAEQVRADAPHLFGRVRRLDAEHEAIEEHLLKVRMMAGASAGDPSAREAISNAVHDLLGRVRRHEQHSSEILMDCYERDFGGE